MTILGLHFPPIKELVEWEGLFLKGTPFEVNKVVLLMWAGVLIVGGLFWAAGRKGASGSLVPVGVQHIAESGIEFVRKDIIMQTMGHDGMRFAPFLTTMFFFIFVTNLFEVIPGIQFPVNARMALPAFLAIVVWLIYNIIGIKSQGPLGYLKSVVMPPGVPKGILPLVALIEFISTFIVRPFSLAVRLFANMLAGHMLILVMLGLIFIFESAVVAVISVPVGTLFYLFEVGIVVTIQAFVFALLSAIYIGGAIEPEH